MLVTTVILWSLNFTVTKYVLDHGFKPLAYSTVRYGAATVIFTLPPGYRPGGNAHIAVPTSSAPASRIQIMTNGEVRVNVVMTGASWCSLANISFPADN